MIQAKIKVVIVEDHLTVRKGVELLLRSQDLSVVGVAEGVKYGKVLVERRRPDVALVDIALADGTGIDLAREVADAAPATGVLLYTGALDERLAGPALRSGARGVALKASPPAELVEGIRAIAGGGTYFDPRLDHVVSQQLVPERDHVLSTREREIFGLLARGMTGEQVARELVLSSDTVRTHIRNGMNKLHASTRVHAVTLALLGEEIVV